MATLRRGLLAAWGWGGTAPRCVMPRPQPSLRHTEAGGRGEGGTGGGGGGVQASCRATSRRPCKSPQAPRPTVT
jgi:hypothetical protein